MIRRALPLFAAAVLAVPALSGCILISTENPEPDPVITTSAPKAPGGSAPASSAPRALPSGLPSLPPVPGGAKPAAVGDPCELLTRVEVIALTGRQVTQVDSDGAAKTAPVRFCQWQQTNGQLAVFVSGTTEADFALQAKAGTKVTGLGDAAYAQSGHLYVRSGDVQIDVYVRGGEDAANLKVAKQAAAKILQRL